MTFLCLSIPHSFLLASVLLASQVTAETQAKTFKHTIPENGFMRNCAFDLAGYAYNLCPLAKEIISAPEMSKAVMPEDDRGEGPSSGRRIFSLSVGGEHWRDQKPNEAPECDKDTWICLMETTLLDNKNVVKFIPLAQRDGGSEIIAISENKGERVHSALRLSTGGERNSPSDITLFCSETEHLSSFNEERGVYSFVWETPYACPRYFSLSAQQTDDDAPKEEEKGDDDLMPKQGMSTIRKLMIVALFALVIPLVCGTILMSSMRTRNFIINKVNGVASTLLPLISTATVKLRPIGDKINTLNSKLKSPFRQSGNKLVLWAQEDMSLADSEDVMVNGTGAFDEDGWNADGLEEYIPLSVNPRHGRRSQVRSYGATPTVETLADRQEGWLKGVGRFFRR